MNDKYELIDSGDGLKLERFGKYCLQRPCQQAIWPKKLSSWEGKADFIFTREGGNQWKKKSQQLPMSWLVEFSGLKLIAKPTDFGHIGVFPEHQMHYEWMKNFIHQHETFKFLNLFAYSGAASLFMAKHGAHVCHVDASKKSVDWARENAEQSELDKKPIRWIVDDAIKFIKREAARKSFYHGILLDPPSFGRGAQGQVFKIEEMLFPLLEHVKNVLDPRGSFIVLTNHTPGITGLVLENCLQALNLPKGELSCGEMAIPAERGYQIPSGTFATWSRKK
jgi:23S rRNA (cytosine1962-C5)-methyltransferase